MKKLLVLLLVFAMASWANAAIVSFSAGDGLPGDTIGITVSSDEQVAGVTLALIADSGFGGTANPGAWNTLFTTADAGYNGTAGGYGAGDLIMVSGGISLGFPATGLLYSYSYDIPSDAAFGATIVFTVGDLPDFGIASSIDYLVEGATAQMSMAGMEFTSTVIPEPMTIALLGLGGLFLLRRRR
ncbi:hypothetical protein ES708_29041 [subsurface metagenome]